LVQRQLNQQPTPEENCNRSVILRTAINVLIRYDHFLKC